MSDQSVTVERIIARRRESDAVAVIVAWANSERERLEALLAEGEDG